MIKDMNRFELFTEMMVAFNKGARIIQDYAKTPRKYGTDVELYVSEMHTLDTIFDNEGTTVTNLANLTNKTKSAITQMTNKLEKKGLLRKLRNDANYKEVNLVLTELGNKTCKYHKTLDKEIYQTAIKYVKKYSNDDLRKCCEIFTTFTQSINKDEFGKE